MVYALAGECGGGTHHARRRPIEKLRGCVRTRDLHASREAGGPTTLSSLAHSGSVARPRSRLGLIVAASAIVVGSAIGSALALRMSPPSAAPRGDSSTDPSAGSPRTGAQAPAPPPAAAASTGTQAAAVTPGTSSPGSPAADPTAAPATASGAPASTAATGAPSAAADPPAAAPSTGTQTAAGASGAMPSTGPGAPALPTGVPAAGNPPSATRAAARAVASPAAAPPSAEAHAALVAQIKDALRRFAAWSHAHPGARCPDAAALGAALDPWGQPLRIVCSDQPADQIAGVLSYGPDGEPGTRDDVVSWALGADVTDLARGPRWTARRGMAAAGTGDRHGGGRPGPRTSPGAPPLAGGSPPARPPRPPPAGAGSNDTDGDGIPDRR